MENQTARPIPKEGQVGIRAAKILLVRRKKVLPRVCIRGFSKRGLSNHYVAYAMRLRGPILGHCLSKFERRLHRDSNNLSMFLVERTALVQAVKFRS